MTSKPAPILPAKDDGSTRETSGEEAGRVEPRDQQTSGGGHRSGSRGAGTFENSDGKTPPGQHPAGGDLRTRRACRPRSPAHPVR